MDDFLEPVACAHCFGKGCNVCVLASAEEVEDANHALRESLKYSVLLHHKLNGCEVDLRFMRLSKGSRIRVVCGGCMSQRSARIGAAPISPASSMFNVEEADVERFAIKDVAYNVAVVRCKLCGRVNLFMDESIRPARRGTTKDKLKLIEDAFRGIVDAAEAVETKADGQ
jgi:hypothetical protein